MDEIGFRIVYLNGPAVIIHTNTKVVYLVDREISPKQVPNKNIIPTLQYRIIS
jgi:hypothetical protein